MESTQELCFRSLRVLEGFVLCLSPQTKRAIYLTKTPFQLNDILMPFHMESDFCDHSGVGMFSSLFKLVLKNVALLCFADDNDDDRLKSLYPLPLRIRQVF